MKIKKKIIQAANHNVDVTVVLPFIFARHAPPGERRQDRVPGLQPAESQDAPRYPGPY